MPIKPIKYKFTLTAAVEGGKATTTTTTNTLCSGWTGRSNSMLGQARPVCVRSPTSRRSIANMYGELNRVVTDVDSELDTECKDETTCGLHIFVKLVCICLTQWLVVDSYGTVYDFVRCGVVRLCPVYCNLFCRVQCIVVFIPSLV